MKKISLFLSLLVGIMSCQKEPSLYSQDTPPKLVVRCYLHPDSVVTAFVSKTSAPLSKTAERLVKDVLVVLYENNLPVDTLLNDSLTIYISKKGFKPTVEKIYAIKASKQGFPTLETFQDTMPPKPKLIKYSAEDSIAPIDRFSMLSRLRLYTDAPKYLKVYGLSPARYIYPVLNKVSYLEWQKGTVGSCEDYYDVPNHRFITSNCTNTPKVFYEFTQSTGRMPYQIRGQKMTLSLGAVTQSGANISKQFNKVGSTLYSGEDTELFWAPIYAAETVKNGYGFLICYNSLNFEVQF
jgi:Domain of unknown function (DUF4249)